MPDDKDQLTSYRLDKLEQQYSEVKTDLKNMMEVLIRLDKRFATLPEDGVNIALQEQLMDDLRKEVDIHQQMLESLQAFKWRSVGIISVILIIMQLFGATLADKLISHKSVIDSNPIKIELVVPNAGTNIPSMYQVPNGQ